MSDVAEEEVTKWIEETLDGELESFDRIMREYQKRVLRLAYQMTGNVEDARDIAQETFLKAFHYLKKFKRGKSFSSWLNRIAINTTFDFLSKRKAAGEVFLSEYHHERAGPLSGVDAGTEERIIAKDLAGKLLERLGILTPQERAAFVLKEIEGYDTAEAAKKMSVRRVTVRRHYGSARKKLKDALFPPKESEKESEK